MYSIMETNTVPFYCLFVFSMMFVYKGMAFEGRVCTNESGGILHCCIHFFANEKGGCEECPIGTTSNGIKCKACPESFFGSRCAKKCYCLPEETCDPIIGCVLPMATKTIVPGRDVNIATLTTNSTRNVNGSTFNIYYYIYYISLGVVIISAITVTMFLHKVRKKCEKRKTIDDVKEPPLESPYSVSYCTTGCHFLDESKMVDNIDTQHVDMGKVQTEAEQKENSLKDSFLHPYQPMETAADIHQNNSFVTSDDVVSDATEEYLNNYNPLLNQNKDDHKYLKRKAVNDKVSTFRFSIPDCTENDHTPTQNLYPNLDEIRTEKIEINVN